MKKQIKRLSGKLNWLKKNNYSRLILILIIGLLVLNNHEKKQEYGIDDSVYWHFPSPYIPDSVSYKQGKEIELAEGQKIKELKHYLGRNNSMSGFMAFDVESNGYCFECDPFGPAYKQQTNLPCLILSGYYLEKEYTFIIKNQKNWLYKETPEYKETVVPFEYHYNKIERRSAGGFLTFKITRFWYHVLNTFSTVCIILLFAGSVFFLTAIIALLANFSSGIFFTDQNIRQFHVLGWIMVGAGLFPALSGSVFYIIFANRIPAGIYFAPLELIRQNSGIIIAGLVVLLIRNAIKQGLQLQKEQELTV